MSQKRKTVAKWFKKWMKPTEDHFKFLFASIWFKDEEIPASSIKNLNNILNDKVDSAVVDAIKDEITVLKKVGLQYLEAIELTANIPYELELPNNVLFYALEVNSVANISLGSSDSVLDDFGTYDSSDTPILELGLRKISKIWISSDVTVEIEPIVYVK